MASLPAASDPPSSHRAPTHSASGVPQELLVVRDHESLRLVSRLTHTALLTSMAIPTTFAFETPESQSIGSGAVILDNVAGQRERGYLLTLLPGRRLEMVVDANSNDENALAVVEIGPNGQATGDAVSFSNTDESVSKQRRKVGAAGSWSVQNSTSRPRHFLLTGSHKRFHDTGDDTWYLSDYRVAFESPDLLCVGWDDSGYKAPEESHRAVLQRDYDDISATIRIEGIASSSEVALGEGQHGRLLDEGPEIDAELLASSDHACSLVVPPRTIAALRVTAQCWLPNAAAVVDPTTGRAIWHDEAWTNNSDFDKLVLGDRGVCVLRNSSDQPREYFLIAKNSMTEPEVPLAWEPSSFEVQLDSENLFVVGFEDSLDHKDWDDVQFYVRMFRQN